MSVSIVVLIIINFLFTALAYGIFPVVFAAFRKKHIKLGTYNFVSFMFNTILAFVIKLSSEPITIGTVQHRNTSFLPCFFWTSVAVGIGVRILRKKGIIKEDNELSKRYICKACGSFSAEPLSECPKCGDKRAYIDRFAKTAVPVDRRFKCQKCGTEFATRQNKCPSCGADRIIERPTIPFVRDEETENPAIIQSVLEKNTPTPPVGSAQKSISTDFGVDSVPDSAESAAEVTKTIPVVRFCRECGERLARDIVFCPTCGTKVIQHPATVTSENDPAIPVVPDYNDGTGHVKEQINGLPPMLRRAFILTEDGEWEKAESYFERVLDDDPENAYAYLGKLLCENRVHELEGIYTIPNLMRNKLYIRALQYSDNALKETLRTLVAQE